MKIPETTYNTLLEAIRVFVDKNGGLETIRSKYISAGLSEKRMRWDLFWVVMRNITQDDTHPYYLNGQWTRFYPYQADFNIYADGVNDDHIDTALRKICRDLDLQFTR
jgi:hypothetical protein